MYWFFFLNNGSYCYLPESVSFCHITTREISRKRCKQVINECSDIHRADSIMYQQEAFSWPIYLHSCLVTPQTTRELTWCFWLLDTWNPVGGANMTSKCVHLCAVVFQCIIQLCQSIYDSVHHVVRMLNLGGLSCVWKHASRVLLLNAL